MSSPIRSGSSDIAKRWLTGSANILWIGTSIGVSLEAGMPLYWPNRPNGYARRGRDIAFFSSDANVTLAEGGFGVAGAGLPYSTNLYTPWGSREAKFTGVAYGAPANNLFNRIMSTGGGGELLQSTRATQAFDGVDWISQCKTLQFGIVTYGTSINQATLVRPFVMDNTSFAALIDLENPDTRAGYKLTWGTGDAQTVVGRTISFDVQVQTGTPTTNAGWTLLLGLVRGDRSGVTVIPASEGGYAVTNWIPGFDTQTVDVAALAALQGLGITDIVVELTTNGASDGEGGFSGQPLYQTQLATLVMQLRQYLPDAAITFLAVHDTNGGNVSSYVDASYAVQQDTPNSQFVNCYEACGDYADVNAMYLSDGVHLSADGVRFELTRMADVMREQADAQTLVQVNREQRVFHSGIAQAGAASTITLATTASATTDYYKDRWIVITNGTGAGQSKPVASYNGTTKVATISGTWATNPSTDSSYAVVSEAMLTTAVETIDDFLDTEIAAIKLKTDLLVTFPTNFSTLGINASGHITRVVLVDTVTDLTETIGGGLDAAGVRAALGMAAADMDDQLNNLGGQLGDLQATNSTQTSALNTLTAFAAEFTSFDFIDAGTQFLSMIDIESGGAVYTVQALENAPSSGVSGSTLVITPVQANAANPRYSTRAMANIGQGSEPTDIWAFVDGAGDPIDLSGKTIRLVFATVASLGDDVDRAFDDTLEGAFQYETGGDGLTVGGADNNQVTLEHDAAKTATAGAYRFFWWNVDDLILLAKGSVTIETTVLEVA